MGNRVGQVSGKVCPVPAHILNIHFLPTMVACLRNYSFEARKETLSALPGS